MTASTVDTIERIEDITLDFVPGSVWKPLGRTRIAAWFSIAGAFVTGADAMNAHPRLLALQCLSI
ncbi:MAG TPA: hypothetical protein VKT72_00905 [Candidatus Baltobacteraceae bacterium]|nr:hypothetical protein [Candidatus Baltobacteraceae bacterium]